MPTPKTKDLSTVIAAFEKSMGNKPEDAKLRVFGTSPVELEIIPFGVPSASSDYVPIDESTGIGGVARGRIVEIYGPESSGKTWLALQLIANAQKKGQTAGWLDPEFSFVGKGWADRWGVDLSKLIFGNDFDCGEQCLQYMLEMTRRKLCDIIVLDSVAALIPKAELEHKLDERTMGEAARMMSISVKQIMQAAASNNVTIVFINQIRDKIGVMFGNPETTPGGKALKFYASMRIRTWRKKIVTKEIQGKAVPQRAISGAKVTKNKVGCPAYEAEYAIEFIAESNDPLMQLVRKAQEFRLITKKRGEDEFIYGTTKDGERTGAVDIKELSEWFKLNEKVEELRLAVVATAQEKKEQLNPVFESPLPEMVIPTVPPAPEDEKDPEGTDPEAA